MQSETIGESLEKFADKIEKASTLGLKLEVPQNAFDRIFVIGMGASGIAGEMLQAYITEIGSRIEVIPVKEYIVPQFIDSRSLVIAVSYSGNTDETIYAYKTARVKAGKTFAITTGGKLEKECRAAGTPVIEVPSGMQPRAALPYLFFPILNTLINSGIIKAEIKYRSIISAIRKVGLREKADDLSDKMLGKVPIIYSSARFHPVALRWKHAINENANTHAFCNIIPEINHNEIMSFAKETDDFVTIMISDESDFSKVNKRISITKDITMKKCETTELILKGDDYLTKVFSAIYIGDLTSYFLAQKYNVSPDETRLIDEVKEIIKRTG
jgi:glucose/mannose-6-phosphate isomerase